MSRRHSLWTIPISLFLLCCGAVGLYGSTSVEDLKVTVGKSIVLDYPSNISRISTSDPAVVDAVAVSTREILLHAKAHGAATVVVWARNGQRNFYNIAVEHDVLPIRKIIEVTFPKEDIHVQSAVDSVTLTGTASTQDVSDRAAAVAASLAKTVINNIQLVEDVETQILLRVRFAEMDRQTGSQFAVNLVSTGALNTPGLISTGQFQSAQATTLTGRIPGGNEGTVSEFTISDALNIFAFRPDLNVGAFV